MNKEDNICYSATRKKEILLLGTTWIDLEDTLLNEVSQRKTGTV